MVINVKYITYGIIITVIAGFFLIIKNVTKDLTFEKCQSTDRSIFVKCIINKAKEDKKTSICNLILDKLRSDPNKENYWNQCIKDTVVASNQPNKCKIITNKNIRHWCIYELAIARNDEILCDMLEDKNFCYFEIANNLKKISFCNKINDKDLKSRCEIESNTECIASKFYNKENKGQYLCNSTAIQQECEKNSLCHWQKFNANTLSLYCTCCPNDLSNSPERCLSQGE